MKTFEYAAPPPALSYEFGDFRIDAAKRLLSRRDGTPVPLTPRVFETLLFLVEHHDTVLDKERLMEAVWPDAIVEENNLSQNISTLRRVFGERPGSHQYIMTVPGRGYRFVAGVTRSDRNLALATEAEVVTPTTSPRKEAIELPTAARLPAAAKQLDKSRSWMIAALALILLASFLIFRNRPRISTTNSTITPPTFEKGIAVLPFTNLSADQENAFFVEGMQDDILTALSKIADLKVISRASVTDYVAGAHRNLREIGRQLGVSEVIEGSVRRAGDRVRVTAQLIDVRTSTHIWAETYDRNLTDVFAIQTEIAQQIANQLQAKLSPIEKSRIEERPTTDLAAYDLYLRAKALWGGWSNSIPEGPILLEIVRILHQAIARDPKFFLAYCYLARVHDALHFAGADGTPARLALAEAAIATAESLQPDSGEVHLVRAEHLYRGYLDYEQARSELNLAERTLPNAAQIFGLKGFIDRRQGRWNESTRNFEKALEVSPRDPHYLGNVAVNYEYQRRYAEAISFRDRILKLSPQAIGARRLRAYLDLASRADPTALHETIEAIVAENPLAASDLAEQWLDLALCEHDSVMMDRALAAIKPTIGSIGATFPFPRAWYVGIAARGRGDATTARAAFASARVEVEAILRDHPDYGPNLGVLGLIDAALGRKEEAIREGQRAVELLPVTKNAMEGARLMEYLAVIYAWTGERDLAIEQVARTLQVPSSLNYGYLRLHPFWDPLRGDARFEKIVADLAPKT